MSQFIGTKNFGVIEVEQSWQVAQRQDAEGNLIQQGGHIALLVNGARCHITGNPFKDEQEIRDVCCRTNGEVIPRMQQVMEETLEWFAHRHDNDAQAIPEITFDGNGFPKYVDGTYLETEDEVYQCLKPGPVMTAAICGLAERRKALREAEMVKPAFEQKAPPPVMEHETAKPEGKRAHPMWKKGKGVKKAAGKAKSAPKPQAVAPAEAATVTV